MNIGKKLYVKDRKAWRSWLSKNYNKKKEIWLVYYKKDSGKQRILYNDAVEEALCHGWIDSTTKKVNEESFAQRFTPRKPKSNLSEMNLQRVRKLITQKKMTKAGLAAIEHAFDSKSKERRFIVPAAILKAIKADKIAWQNFRKFPESYKRNVLHTLKVVNVMVKSSIKKH